MGVAGAVRPVLDQAAIDDSGERAEIGAALGDAGPPGLRGDLRVVPLAEVLQLLDAENPSLPTRLDCATRAASTTGSYWRR